MTFRILHATVVLALLANPCAFAQPYTNKIVDGVAVPLTQGDLDQRLADDAASARKQALQAIDDTFAHLIAGGIQITSTGTPALNGAYYADEQAQGKLSGVITGIAAGQGLPGGAATFSYLDTSGVPHSFTADQITALAKAVRDFVYAATIARATAQAGGTPSWPSNQITVP